MAIVILAKAIQPNGKFKKNELFVRANGNGLMLMMEQLEAWNREYIMKVSVRYNKDDEKFFLITLDLPYEDVKLLADYINENS